MRILILISILFLSTAQAETLGVICLENEWEVPPCISRIDDYFNLPYRPDPSNTPEDVGLTVEDVETALGGTGQGTGNG